MNKGVIRTRKDGGCSVCRSSEENVGKKRCCHILDDAEMKIRHERGINFIDITDEKKQIVSIKTNENKIKNYIASLSEGLSEEDKEDILALIKEL